MARSTRDRLLDAGTGLLLAGVLALLVRDRVLPAWRARQAVEVGRDVPEELVFEALASGDTITAPSEARTLLLVLQSSCPACRAVVPAWTDLVRRRDPSVRVLAVALEAPEPGLAYVRARLPDALAVRPVSTGRFLRRLAIRAVPTTVVIDRDRRLRYRRSGLLDDVEAAALLRLVEPERGLAEGDLQTPAGALDLR